MTDELCTICEHPWDPHVVAVEDRFLNVEAMREAIKNKTIIGEVTCPEPECECRSTLGASVANLVELQLEDRP